MSDAAHKATDKRIAALEKKIGGVYGRAKKELAETASSFFAQFTEQDKANRALVKAGNMTEKEYKNWRKEQMMRGEHYKRLQKQIASTMLNADKEAARMINNELPRVAAINCNQVLSDVKSKVKGYSYELVNQQTVQNLLENHKTLLPYKKVNGRKVERWNTRQVNSEILQGIIQGESIDQISSRLSKNVAGMEAKTAVRNARTAITGAENAGRFAAQEQAQEEGVIMKKEWIATQDERTREAHLELDGVQVDIDAKFHNSIGEIEYPGDPNADPANTYNCRCTLGTVIVGFRKPKEKKEEK